DFARQWGERGSWGGRASGLERASSARARGAAGGRDGAGRSGSVSTAKPATESRGSSERSRGASQLKGPAAGPVSPGERFTMPRSRPVNSLKRLIAELVATPSRDVNLRLPGRRDILGGHARPVHSARRPPAGALGASRQRGARRCARAGDGAGETPLGPGTLH